MKIKEYSSTKKKELIFVDVVKVGDFYNALKSHETAKNTQKSLYFFICCRKVRGDRVRQEVGFSIHHPTRPTNILMKNKLML